MNKSPSPTNEADSFDRLITKTQDKKTNKSAKRIHYNTKSGNRKTINYKGNNKYEILIYKSIKEALYSEWFNEKKETTKCTYYDHVYRFFSWLSSSGWATTNENKYEILKGHEEHELNALGIKNSKLGVLNQLINEGAGSGGFSLSQINYLFTLTKLSSPAKSPQASPITLSRWFNLPWLREEIGEKLYLQIESPKILGLPHIMWVAKSDLRLPALNPAHRSGNKWHCGIALCCGSRKLSP